MAGIQFSVTTEGEVALVAATEKTVLQIVAAANHRTLIKEWGIAFDGTSNTAEPVEVELRRISTDATVSAATEQKLNEGDNETIQSAGGYNATVEPTTKTQVVMGRNVHPQTSFTWQAPFGGEIPIIGGNAAGLIVTAPANVNAWAYFICEE